MLTLRSYIFLNVFQLPDVFYLVGTNCYPFGIPFWTGDNRDRTQGCAADPRQMHQFVRWCFFHMEAMPQKSGLRLSTDSAGMFDESLNFSRSFEMVVISPDTTAKIFYLDSLTLLNCVCGTMRGRGELQAHLYQLVQLPTWCILTSFWPFLSRQILAPPESHWVALAWELAVCESSIWNFVHEGGRVGGTVTPLVELLPRIARDLGLILTSCGLWVESAFPSCDSMGFIRVLGFPPVSQKLPLMYRK